MLRPFVLGLSLSFQFRSDPKLGILFFFSQSFRKFRLSLVGLGQNIPNEKKFEVLWRGSLLFLDINIPSPPSIVVPNMQFSDPLWLHF